MWLTNCWQTARRKCAATWQMPTQAGHIGKAQLPIDLTVGECFVILPKHGKVCSLERRCTFLEEGCHRAVSHLPLGLWSDMRLSRAAPCTLAGCKTIRRSVLPTKLRLRLCVPGSSSTCHTHPVFQGKRGGQ